jgi:selenophosphate synthetase-related protein
LHEALAEFAGAGVLSSARDVSDGGLLGSLAEACISSGLGAAVWIGEVANPAVAASPWELLFCEPSSAAIVSCGVDRIGELKAIGDRWGLYVLRIGEVRGDLLQVSVYTVNIVSASVAELRPVWSAALESQLAEEVTA